MSSNTQVKYHSIEDVYPIDGVVEVMKDDGQWVRGQVDYHGPKSLDIRFQDNSQPGWKFLKTVKFDEAPEKLRWPDGQAFHLKCSNTSPSPPSSTSANPQLNIIPADQPSHSPPNKPVADSQQAVSSAAEPPPKSPTLSINNTAQELKPPPKSPTHSNTTTPVKERPPPKSPTHSNTTSPFKKRTSTGSGPDHGEEKGIRSRIRSKLHDIFHPSSSSPPSPSESPQKIPEPPMQFQSEAGAKRAVLVGINYKGQKGELRGCVNDVATMRNFIEGHGYLKENMTILVDDASWKTEPPTRSNITKALANMARSARPGDSLFFHYSGHGGRVKDKDGDEADGYDETLIPVDFRKAGQITDDELFKVLVQPLASGVRLTAVMDCCHSGSVLDLPFEFVARPKNMETVFKGGKIDPGASFKMTQNQKFSKLETKVNKKWAHEASKAVTPTNPKSPQSGPNGTGFQNSGKNKVAGDVIMFSGCADHQTSSDVSNTSGFDLPSGSGPGGAGGACTNALVAAFSAKPNITFIQLLEDMRLILVEKKFNQVPQLSSSRPVDLTQPFTL